MKTGFEKLDNIIGKLNAGELTCIASRPALGKTTLSINIANNVSNQTNKKVIFINLENSKEQLEKRLNSNIEIITDKLFITDIEDTCRDLSYTYELELIIVDYLQLIKPSIRRRNIEQETTDVIKALKQLSIELNVPIIINYQLSSFSKNEIPNLEDFKVTTYHYHKVLVLYKENDELKIDVIKNKGISHKTVTLSLSNDIFSNSKNNFQKEELKKVLNQMSFNSDDELIEYMNNIVDEIIEEKTNY